MLFEELAGYLTEISQFDKLIHKLEKIEGALKQELSVAGSALASHTARADETPSQVLWGALKIFIAHLKSLFNRPTVEYKKTVSFMIYDLCKYDRQVVNTVQTIFTILKKSGWTNEEIVETVMSVWHDQEKMQARRPAEPAICFLKFSSDALVPVAYPVREFGHRKKLRGTLPNGLRAKVCLSHIQVLVFRNPEAVPGFMRLLMTLNPTEEMLLNAICVQDSEGNTPIHLLTEHFTPFMQFLEQINFDTNGQTAFAQAITYENNAGFTCLDMVAIKIPSALSSFFKYLSQSEAGLSGLAYALNQSVKEGRSNDFIRGITHNYYALADLLRCLSQSPDVHKAFVNILATTKTSEGMRGGTFLGEVVGTHRMLITNFLECLSQSEEGQSLLVNTLTETDFKGHTALHDLAINCYRAVPTFLKCLPQSIEGQRALMQFLTREDTDGLTGLDVFIEHSLNAVPELLEYLAHNEAAQDIFELLDRIKKLYS